MNSTFYRRLLSIASAFGAIGVATGAFGAHFLKSRLEASDLEIIKTGVLYLFIHTLATILVYTISRQGDQTRWLKLAGTAFLVGIGLFSGSLFVIGTSSLTGFPANWVGIATPLGGLCFIVGWISFSLHSLKSR